MLLTLLLAGCGYPSYYPRTTYTGAPDTADTDTGADIPCGQALSYDPVELRVTSYSGRRDLYEVGSDCVEVRVGPLPTGETVPVDTFPGEVFVVRDETGDLRDALQVPYGYPTYDWGVP